MIAPHTATEHARFLSDLTPREHEVAGLIAKGFTNAQIAGELTIGLETVKSHVSNILSKLGIDGRQGVSRVLAASEVVRYD